MYGSTLREIPANRPVTDKQVNRLFAIASARRWSKQAVISRMETWYKKSEPKLLSRAEYDRLCNYILSHSEQGGVY